MRFYPLFSCLFIPVVVFRAFFEEWRSLKGDTYFWLVCELRFVKKSDSCWLCDAFRAFFGTNSMIYFSAMAFVTLLDCLELYFSLVSLEDLFTVLLCLFVMRLFR